MHGRAFSSASKDPAEAQAQVLAVGVALAQPPPRVDRVGLLECVDQRQDHVPEAGGQRSGSDLDAVVEPVTVGAALSPGLPGSRQRRLRELPDELPAARVVGQLRAGRRDAPLQLAGDERVDRMPRSCCAAGWFDGTVLWHRRAHRWITGGRAAGSRAVR